MTHVLARRWTIGLGAAGEEGFELGAARGATAVAERGGVFDEETAWDALAEIPEDSAAALVLLEHRWAIPLRDAVARAGALMAVARVRPDPHRLMPATAGSRPTRGPAS